MKTSAHPDQHPNTPMSLEQQAWEWLRLLKSGEADAEDAQRFRDWVQASQAHRSAYQQVKQRWDAFRQPAGALLRAQPELAARLGKAPRDRSSRRAFLGFAAGAAAAAAGVAVVYPPLGLWPGFQEWDADDRTAVGEQRALGLGERVNVTLNTQTSVRRRLADRQTVGLDLLDGELAVDLGRGGRPFTVAAGAGRSEAAAGQFEVRYLDGKVCVTCIEGAVRVSHPAGERVLQARQQTVYSATALSGVAGIDPAVASAWRRGFLVFNDVRLGDALKEINRYRSGRVVLMNEAMRDKAVSGRFAIASLDLALVQLQHAVGLTSHALPGGVLLLS